MGDLAQRIRRYLVTDPRAGTPEKLLAICRAALDGGMTAVQLRVKGWSDQRAFEAAVGLRALCDEHGALFLVNDRVDLALASRADGVHLGVDDLPVGVARELLGPGTIIGYSPETTEDRENAIANGVDYLGIGPVYGTATKGDAGPALGLEHFAALVESSSVPVIGIGGITVERAAEVVDAGAVGVAIVSAIFLADDPQAAASRLREVLP